MPRRSPWALAALLLLIALAAALRFSSLAYDYNHPDEVIAVKVSEGIVARGEPDTNWKRADLPGVFRYPQFNFSGYMLAAAGALQAANVAQDAPDTLVVLRTFSVLLGVLAVVLTFVVGRQWFGTAAGLLAATVVAVQPLLYQDSLYARPETFVTVLTLAVLALLGERQAPHPARALAAAFLVGILIATKVSMLLLAPVLLLGVRWDGADRLRTMLAIALAVLLGAVAAAPYAVPEFIDFADGVEALRRQYTGGHWPHGLPQAGALERFAHAGQYFLGTSGPLFLFSFAGVASCAMAGQRRPLAFFLFAFATALQFMTYAVFFERNLSHVVPVFAIFAAQGLLAFGRWAAGTAWARRALTALASLLVLVPSLATTLELRFVELPGRYERELATLRAQVEARLGLRAIRLGWTQDRHSVLSSAAFICAPVLIELPIADDPVSVRLLEELENDWGYKPVARFRAGFEGMPVSTLHVYFTSPKVFLHKPLDIGRCRDFGGGLLTKDVVGEKLPVLALRADPAWTPGGAWNMERDAFDDPGYFGSWSGTDRHQGRVEVTVLTAGSDLIVLPYLTGPKPRGQTIAFYDGDTGKLLVKAPAARTLTWRFAMLRLPAMTQSVRIVAEDAGSGWGEWHAIGLPRAVKTTGSAPSS